MPDLIGPLLGQLFAARSPVGPSPLLPPGVSMPRRARVGVVAGRTVTGPRPTPSQTQPTGAQPPNAPRFRSLLYSQPGVGVP